MGKKRNNKKKIENKCANVSNIETMTDKENPEIEARRSSRTGTIIAVIAIVATICSFLFKCVQDVLKVWPQSGYIHYVFMWSIFIVPLSCALVILWDIVVFVVNDLNRCNVCDSNFRSYDDISDKKYSELIKDFKIMLGLVLVIVGVYGGVALVTQKNIIGIVSISIFIISIFIACVISVKDKKRKSIPWRQIWNVLKRCIVFGVVTLVVFAMSLGIITNTRGQFICTFGENGLVELQNAIDDNYCDAKIIIRDISDEEILNIDISKDKLLLAKETLENDLTDEKGNVMGTAQKLSGEMLYWKYRMNMNEFGLSDGKYSLAIELHQGSCHVTVLNMFVLENGKYYYGTDKLVKNY